MANTHAPPLPPRRASSWSAAVEPNEERRKAFMKAHKIRQGFADLDAAIAWGKFDAAANVTPDAVHHPTTMS